MKYRYGIQSKKPQWVLPILRPYMGYINNFDTFEVREHPVTIYGLLPKDDTNGNVVVLKIEDDAGKFECESVFFGKDTIPTVASWCSHVINKWLHIPANFDIVRKRRSYSFSGGESDRPLHIKRPEIEGNLLSVLRAMDTIQQDANDSVVYEFFIGSKL